MLPLLGHHCRRRLWRTTVRTSSWRFRLRLRHLRLRCSVAQPTGMHAGDGWVTEQLAVRRTARRQRPTHISSSMTKHVAASARSAKSPSTMTTCECGVAISFIAGHASGAARHRSITRLTSRPNCLRDANVNGICSKPAHAGTIAVRYPRYASPTFWEAATWGSGKQHRRA